MDYTTLVGAKTLEGSIRNAVNHSEVPASAVLKDAESFLSEYLRTEDTRKLSTGTLAASASTLDISSLRATNPLSFHFTGDHRLNVPFLTADDFERYYSPDTDGTPQQGQPRAALFSPDQIRFDTETDQSYLYRFWYHERPEALSGTNETNFLTTKHSLLLRACTNWLAYEWMKQDSSADRWKRICEERLMRVAQAGDEAMYASAHVETHLNGY